MPYGPKTQAFYEKNKLLEKDNPIANVDENKSMQEISELIDVNNFRKDAHEFFKVYSQAKTPDNIECFPIEHRLAKILVFKPKHLTLPAPTIIYFPAGGYVLDMSEEQKPHCVKLALQANAIVVSVTPHLAPEIKLPQIADEAYTVVKELYQHANQHNIDKQNFFLSGYSAGSKLSMLLALRAKHDPDFNIKAMALISGDYDLSQASAMEEEDIFARQRDFMAKPGMMKFFISHYIPSLGHDLKDPILSPYYADVTGLPPTTLIVGDCDVFLGENKSMAKKLKANHVETQLIINPGHIHNTTLMFDAELGDGEDPILQAANALKRYIK